MFDRRTALGLIGATGVAACAKGGGGDNVLRVGSQRGGTKAMLTGSGTLEGLPFKIEWSEFPAAQHLLEALGAGAIDLGGVGDAPFLFAYQSGSPIRSVQAIRYESRNAATAILVRRDSPILDIGQLKGKRIATGRGSVGHFLLLKAMERARLSARDLTIVFLPPGDAKGAFSSKAIDAWSTWNPYSAAAILHDGARSIIDLRSTRETYGFIAANDLAIAAKRPLIEGFLTRHARALRWASSHIDDYTRDLALETGLPADVARYTADRRSIPVATDATVIAAQQDVLETFRKSGAGDFHRSLANAYDTGFNATVVA